MARNGSGTYSNPYPDFVAGQTIRSSEVDANFSDIATALTQSLALDGQSVLTGQLKLADGTVTAPGITFGNDLNTGLYRIGADNIGVAIGGAKVAEFQAGGLEFAAAVSVASAATADIGAAASNLVTITGNTTITGLGTADSGLVKLVRFAGALTLTHNATSLILPTGANITTAAGDTALFASEGSGNWRCHRYQTASGRPLLRDGWQLIQAQTVSSAVATVDFTTGLDNTYDQFMLIFEAVQPATDGVLPCLRVGTGAGPTWQTGASSYAYSGRVQIPSTGADFGSAADTLDTLIGLTRSGNPATNNANYTLSGVVHFANPEATPLRPFFWQIGYAQQTTLTANSAVGAGQFVNTGALTGVRFFFGSGNIAGGTFRLYGLTK